MPVGQADRNNAYWDYQCLGGSGYKHAGKKITPYKTHKIYIIILAETKACKQVNRPEFLIDPKNTDGCAKLDGRASGRTT